MLSLCDILAIIYSKLVEDNSSSENINLFQAIIRFDEKIKVRSPFFTEAAKVPCDSFRRLTPLRCRIEIGD